MIVIGLLLAGALFFGALVAMAKEQTNIGVRPGEDDE